MCHTVRSKKKRRRGKKKTYAAKSQRSRLVFGKANGCWIPKWLMLIGSQQNTINRDIVDGVAKLWNMFKGQQAKFTSKAKRIIAVSSLAAAGASDYGVQSLIFRTLNAITEDVNMGLTDKELATGCSDVRT